MLAEGDRPVYASDGCEIDLARRELRVLGAAVPLGPRAFEIVELLARSAGRLVSKDELMERVWPGAFVLENTLQVHIASVRRALGPCRALLKTESGRGYRLLGTWSAPDPGSDAVAASNRPLRLPGETRTSNFPAAVTNLVGRAATVRSVRDLLSAYRIVTLTGPGGIGKTTLGIEAARGILGDFTGGGWLVELAPLADAGLVSSSVAEVLGLKLIGGAISAEAVARAIGDANLLLILDNCEHVIDAAAALAEAVVRFCPRASVLATSREVLRIDDERVYRVPPLDVPEIGEEDLQQVLGCGAVELLFARTTALDPAFSLASDDIPSIAAICRQLDGIPLAIEFAAARAATLGLRPVAAGLGDRFRLLTSGRRTALPRHQTLRAALDWSYELLPPDERRLLRHLAIFPGGFTFEAAEAVGAPEGAGDFIVDGISSLVAKSLLTVDEGASGPRWRLLETIRTYALEKLAASGEHLSAARRHAAYFRDLFASAIPDFRSRHSAEELVRYGREIDNVRAALDWAFSASGDGAIGVDLTAAYAPVWMNFSLVAECRERCEQALHRLDAGTQANARLQMVLQICLGVSLSHSSGPSAQAQLILIKAFETAVVLGDFDAQARALFLLTWVYRYRAEYGKATTAIKRLRHIAQQIGDPVITVTVERNFGNNLVDIGRLSEAQRCFERIIQSPVHVEGQRLPIWRRPFSEIWRLSDRAMARAMLARALWLQGFAERAKNEAQASLGELQGADQPTICQVLHFSICKIAPMTGDFVAAERAIARLIEAATSLNSQFWMTVAQFVEGKLLVERGKFAEGLVALRTAFGTCDESGWCPSYPEFRGSLALALGGLGRLDEAENMVNEAIAVAGGREHGHQWYVPELLRIKAEILLRQSADQSGLAEDCLGQAATMAREQGALFWELRAALSVARLRVRQNDRAGAARVLRPVYDRFTEGFGATDLKEAKALLDGLR